MVNKIDLNAQPLKNLTPVSQLTRAEKLQRYNRLCEELTNLWRQYDVVASRLNDPDSKNKLENKYYDYFYVMKHLEDTYKNHKRASKNDPQLGEDDKDYSLLYREFLNQVNDKYIRNSANSVCLANADIALLKDYKKDKVRIKYLKEQLRDLGDSLCYEIPDYITQSDIKQMYKATDRLSYFLNGQNGRYLNRLCEQANAILECASGQTKLSNIDHYKASVNAHLANEKEGAKLFYKPANSTVDHKNIDEVAWQLVVDNITKQAQSLLATCSHVFEETDYIIRYFSQHKQAIDELVNSNEPISKKSSQQRYFLIHCANQLQSLNHHLKYVFSHYYIPLNKIYKNEISGLLNRHEDTGCLTQDQTDQLEQLQTSLKEQNNVWRKSVAMGVLNPYYVNNQEGDAGVECLHKMTNYLETLKNQLPQEQVKLRDLIDPNPVLDKGLKELSKSDDGELRYAPGKEAIPKVIANPYDALVECYAFVNNQKQNSLKDSDGQYDQVVYDANILSLVNGWPKDLEQQFCQNRQKLADNNWGKEPKSPASYKPGRRYAIDQRPKELRMSKQPQAILRETDIDSQPKTGWLQALKNFFSRNKENSDFVPQHVNPMHNSIVSSGSSRASQASSMSGQQQTEGLWDKIKRWGRKLTQCFRSNSSQGSTAKIIDFDNSHTSCRRSEMPSTHTASSNIGQLNPTHWGETPPPLNLSRASNSTNPRSYSRSTDEPQSPSHRFEVGVTTPVESSVTPVEEVSETFESEESDESEASPSASPDERGRYENNLQDNSNKQRSKSVP